MFIFRRVHYFFKILSTMLVLKLLDRLCYPEHIGLITFGRFVAGDIVVANNGGRLIEVGRVEKNNDQADIIYLRFYRRPK